MSAAYGAAMALSSYVQNMYTDALSYLENGGSQDELARNLACLNNGDGFIDFPFDIGCLAAGDPSESAPPGLPGCANGLDDDNDGLTDWFESNDGNDDTGQFDHDNDGIEDYTDDDDDGDGILDELEQ